MPSHDPEIPDIGNQMLPKTSKMIPKNDPKTKKLDFQKRVFYYRETLLFEVMTPSKPTKETNQGIWSAFWHHKYEKVSQLAPKCLPMSSSRRSKIHWISSKHRFRQKDPRGQPLEPVAAPRLLKWCSELPRWHIFPPTTNQIWLPVERTPTETWWAFL